MPLRRDLRSQEPVSIPNLELNASSLGELSRIGKPVNPADNIQYKKPNATGKDAVLSSQSVPSEEENKVRRAEKLKIDMTKSSEMLGNFVRHDTDGKTSQRQYTGSVDPSIRKSNKSEIAPRAISTFDNTETLDFDVSSQNVDNQTMVFRGHGMADHGQNGSHAVVQHAEESTQASVLRNLGPHWRWEVAEQRRYLGWDSDNDDIDVHASPEHGGSAQAMPYDATQDTPLRSKHGLHTVRNVAGHTKNVTFAQSPGSKELAKKWQLNQSAANQSKNNPRVPQDFNVLPNNSDSETMTPKLYMEVPSRRSSYADLGPTKSLGQQPKVTMLPIKSGFESSRASDTTTSSDEGEVAEIEEAPSEFATPNLNQTNKKRSRKEDLDHDLHDLKSMTFDQLCKEQFCIDPRSSAYGHVSGDKSLPEKLDKIEQLDGENLKDHFREQSDEEWAATGSWFVDRITHDLKRLMQARCERRKLSLHYENKIRQRQQEIEWYAAGLDNELQELKKGGGELIEGRKTNSMKAGD